MIKSKLTGACSIEVIQEKKRLSTHLRPTNAILYPEGDITSDCVFCSS